MKTATVADLRNHFRRVSTWVEHGETVEIIKRGRAFAHLTAVRPVSSQLVKPDIMNQLREVWGDRVFSMDEVRSMKEAELEGEEG
ncbi:MAG: type II toxin-antitoxin system Phd/YefM family antitoxin [Terrimicrobiaceae bacterium]